MNIPEYVVDANVSASQLRNFQDMDVVIAKVYPAHRQGFDKVANKMHSAYRFPTRLTAEVVISWDPEAKIKDGDTFEFREKIWNKESKKFEFHKIPNNKEFYQFYKKVYDMDIVASNEVNVVVYDKTIKEKVSVTLPKNSVVRIEGISASKFCELLESLDMDSDVALVDGKDKLGNPCKRKPFDWEDGKISSIVGVPFRFKVRGEGTDTRYTFKEGIEFSLAKEASAEGVTIEDCPFN